MFKDISEVVCDVSQLSRQTSTLGRHCHMLDKIDHELLVTKMQIFCRPCGPWA